MRMLAELTLVCAQLPQLVCHTGAVCDGHKQRHPRLGCAGHRGASCCCCVGGCGRGAVERTLQAEARWQCAAARHSRSCSRLGLQQHNQAALSIRWLCTRLAVQHCRREDMRKQVGSGGSGGSGSRQWLPGSDGGILPAGMPFTTSFVRCCHGRGWQAKLWPRPVGWQRFWRH